jgi:single-strand DNA-binding protein
MQQVRGTLNHVELIGWLGDAPEQRVFASGARVCSFNVATRRIGPKNEQGVREYETEWMTIEAWDRLAEQCAESLGKGSRVHVNGSLQTRSWEDRESGQRRSRTIVRAASVLFLEPRPETADAEETEEVGANVM